MIGVLAMHVAVEGYLWDGDRGLCMNLGSKVDKCTPGLLMMTSHGLL